jgi:hypothetical protein
MIKFDGDRMNVNEHKSSNKGILHRSHILMPKIGGNYEI